MTDHVPVSDEVREEVAALWQEMRQAEIEYASARNKRDTDEISEKLDQLRTEYQERREELLAGTDVAKRKRVAEDAYNAHPETVSVRWSNGEQAVDRCAKSGRVLLESDETVVDDETGETFLRSELGLPPRPVEEVEVEYETEDEDADTNVGEAAA